MATRFYYQKGPVVTYENWEFPTTERVDAFFKSYVPEFKRIFKDVPGYELYFHGSCRDRVMGYTQTYCGEQSYDVDIVILTTYPNPDEHVDKIYEAMWTAVKVGFEHKILIDVCCKEKPFYTEYEDFMHHRIAQSDTPVYMYRLNPIIKRYDDYYFEKYIDDKKDHLVKTVLSNNVYKNKKIITKMSEGWVQYKPTRIA